MQRHIPYTINVHSRLLDLSVPRVMGILNATPDSFFSDSRMQTEREIAYRTTEIVEQGGDIIDVGAYSTRPGASEVPVEEEMARLRVALQVIRREQPDAILSVDTFRADVARMCVEEYGVSIINDVSEMADEAMARTVARLGVPYILMSVQPTLREMLIGLADKVQQLRNQGAKDIIIDPGFGFGKTLDQNYQLMYELEKLHVLGLPLLVGISRKSMIYKRLNCTPAEALNGTTVLNTIALTKGASILRVHDVREAVETVALSIKNYALNICFSNLE